MTCLKAHLSTVLVPVSISRFPEWSTVNFLRLFQSDGTGICSIYGGSKFADENFTVKHAAPGMLSMASFYSTFSMITNATPMFINLSYGCLLMPLGEQWKRLQWMPIFHHLCPVWFSGRKACGLWYVLSSRALASLNPVMFMLLFLSFVGQVVDGMLVLKKIENVPTGPHNRPKVAVIISQCGEMWLFSYFSRERMLLHLWINSVLCSS